MEIYGPRTAAASYKPAPVYRMTNFYPLYDGDNDQVDSVSAVKGAAFQTVVPRYRLSTSETRDQGTGPAFEEISALSMPVVTRVNGSVSQAEGQESLSREPVGRASIERAPLDMFQGNRIDLFA